MTDKFAYNKELRELFTYLPRTGELFYTATGKAPRVRPSEPKNIVIDHPEVKYGPISRTKVIVMIVRDVHYGDVRVKIYDSSLGWPAKFAWENLIVTEPYDKPSRKPLPKPL